jgi:VCBS repeat-containing protein
LNYAGEFEFSHFGGDAPSGASNGVVTKNDVLSHADAHTIVVPDAHLLFSGDYKRAGVDLVLSKDGHDYVVSDYFKGHSRATLSSPDGANLSGDLVNALTGEVQLAQLGGGATAAATVIGHVTKLTGSATAIRNGVSIQLNMGDNVQKGDVVQAGADSSLGLTFIDGTVFGLSANARMVLNEMVYDPNGSSNSSLLSLVQGTITFVAGETAKHGDMKVDTPVATMGIRGTAVLVEIGFEVPGQGGAPPVKFQVLVEPGGRAGSYVLYSKTGSILGSVNQAGQVTSVLGNGDTSTGQAPPLTDVAKDIINKVFEQYFPGYVPNANPQSGGPIGGSTPQNPNTGTSPDPLKFYQPPDPLPGVPTPVPIKYQDDSGTHTIDVILTRFNSAPTIVVTPIVVTLPVNKTSFDIADQPIITDPDAGDVIIPYVPGSAHLISATGPANGPSSAALARLITIDPPTGHVTYDPAAFKFLPTGTAAIYTIGFDVQSGPDTAHETLTFTVDGANDAPLAAAALTVPVHEGDSAITTNLLAGASDPDAGETATLSVANVRYAIDGHAASTTTPAGLTLTGAVLSVDPKNAAFDHLAQGETTTIVVSYDVTDTHGATITQTETITITGTNDAPVVAAALTVTAAESDVAFTANLLAGASDVDTGETATLSVTNVKYAVDGGTASATAPTGISLTGATLSVDPKNAAFDHLAQDVTATIVVSYEITDAHGATTTQTETITITGTNDAPVVAAALTVTAAESDCAFTADLLAGASDVDTGETATLSVTNVKYAVDGGTASAAVPDGLSLTGSTLTVDPKSSAFDHLAACQTTTIIVSYDVTDAHGATVAQTETITITGTNDAPVIANVDAGTLTDTTAYDTFGNLVGTLAGTDVDTGETSLLTYGAFNSSHVATNDAVAGHYGSLTVNLDGSYTYVPNSAVINALPAGSFDDSFTIETMDPQGAFGTATLTVHVKGVDDGPLSVVWTGAANNGIWNSPGNWNPAHVPSGTDTAVFNLASVALVLSADIVVAGLQVAAGTQINITASGGSHSIDVVDSLVNNGNIVLHPDTTLELHGVVQNNIDGVISVDAAFNQPGSTLLIDGHVSFEGGGTITLDGVNDRITGTFSWYHLSTLENVDNTINGYGKLGDGHLNIVNDADGRIAATDAHYALVIDTGYYGSLTNHGAIDSDANGGLVIEQSMVNASDGTLNASAGRFEIEGNLVNHGMLNAVGGLFMVDGDVTGHGHANIMNGTLEFGDDSDTSVQFVSDAHGTLILDDVDDFTGAVTGFGQGDTIDLTGISSSHVHIVTVNGVTKVQYGFGQNDFFTIAGDGSPNHLVVSSDNHGGTEIEWQNDAPTLDTSDAHLSESGDHYTISGLSVSDSDASSADIYTAAVNGQTTKTGSLSKVDDYLDDGFQFTPSNSSASQATVAVKVTDGYGASDHVNFIFNTAPLSSHTQVTLTGTNEDDVIFATSNTDELWGKGGADQFVFGPHSGPADKDVIKDFQVGIDKIEFDHIRGVPALSGPFGDLQLFAWELSGGIQQKGNDTLIHLEGDTLLLTGVHMASLHASDFIVHPYSNFA